MAPRLLLPLERIQQGIHDRAVLMLRATGIEVEPSSSRGPVMSRTCPRPGLSKLVTSWVLKPGSTGRPLMTWGSTRALV